MMVQSTWLGFNLRDISNPNAPTQISYTSCNGNQGDVIVYRNIVVRSWNSPASATPGASQNPLGRAETNCDGQPVAVGFEGVHVFDITNRADPQLVAQVATPQGSHTATGVPDPANNRLLVYNAASSATTPQIDVISVPLGAPANATLIRVGAGRRVVPRHLRHPRRHDDGQLLGRERLPRVLARRAARRVARPSPSSSTACASRR